MSKRAEAIKTLRDMNDAELQDHLRQQRRRLFELRFQQATGQVENHRQIREARREIARTMTMQIELQRVAGVAEVVQEAPAVAARPSRGLLRRRGRATATEEAAASQETDATDETAEPSAEPAAEMETETSTENDDE